MILTTLVTAALVAKVRKSGSLKKHLAWGASKVLVKKAV